MSFGVLILLAGILFFLTPMAMAWVKFGAVNEGTIVKLMMEMSMEQMHTLRLMNQSGIAFVFMGGALVLMGL